MLTRLVTGSRWYDYVTHGTSVAPAYHLVMSEFS